MTESVVVSLKTNGKDVKTAKNAKPRAVKTRTATTEPKAAKAKVKKTVETLAVSLEERHRLIAERAYILAEQRGFSGGNSVDDWLAAEAEVENSFKPKKGKRASN